jgi:hypothetical protein
LLASKTAAKASTNSSEALSISLDILSLCFRIG